MNRLLACLGTFVLLVPALAEEPAKKLPAPDAATQAAAEKLIKNLFKDDFAKKKPAELLALSAKLLEQAQETRDDAAARFVLFREARDLAPQAGELPRALAVIERLAREFDVSRPAMKADVLSAATGLPATPTLPKTLAETALEVIDEAIAADDFASAGRLVKLAEGAAQKAKSTPLATTAQARAKEIDAARKEFDKAKEAADALAKDPKNAAAHLVLGKRLCLRKGDWDQGPVHLIEGGDPKLKELALKELKAPSEPADQVDLAEGWVEYARPQAEPDKTAMLLRAYHWLRQARPKLTGISRTKVDKLLLAMPRHYLVDLDEFDVKLGPWRFGKGELNGAVIEVNEVRSPNGLGLHPPANDHAAVKYKLAKSGKTFKALVALHDNTGGSLTPITFVVLGDGKPLWTSKPIKLSHEPQTCTVSVTGVDVLELRVVCPGKYEGAHAVWVEPHVLR
ncbi:MAG: NPCBM/NEW2 domain-containing protein [Planctomycetia bacterium]|nr:NPCBM/NEW2 domain-containing protein [Planctomycetia bacterium]